MATTAKKKTTKRQAKRGAKKRPAMKKPERYVNDHGEPSVWLGEHSTARCACGGRMRVVAHGHEGTDIREMRFGRYRSVSATLHCRACGATLLTLHRQDDDRARPAWKDAIDLVARTALRDWLFGALDQGEAHRAASAS